MKNHELVNFLKNRQLFVISPHYDDAILSLGMFLYNLKAHSKITIINIFTKAHKGPYTFSGKKFIDKTKYDNANDLFRQRAIEDKKVISKINAKIIYLRLVDALFRKKTKKTNLGKYIAEFDHIYPTYRWHILKKIQSNDTALKELKTKLKKLIPQDSIVFSPFGIGNHVDHIITKKACSALFKNLIYYIDFPYNIRSNNYGVLPYKYNKNEFNVNLAVKSELAHYYLTQIYNLFPKGILPQHKEIIFTPEKFIPKSYNKQIKI